MTENIVAIIPARAGSIRLPGKNMLDLGGKPLVQWTIEAAIKAHLFRQIIVSTNDRRVESLAFQYGLVRIWQTDFEQNEDAMLNVVREAIKSRTEAFVMLLQPTSPFRTAHHILTAWTIFQGGFPADSLVTVDSFDRVNGGIYLFTRARIRAGKPIYDDNDSLRYAMSGPASIDIDTQADLNQARYMLESAK
jgi:CMP-N-acetylneuraminic acid synthetase